MSSEESVDDIVKRILFDATEGRRTLEQIKIDFKPTTLGELLLRNDFEGTKAMISKAIVEMMDSGSRTDMNCVVQCLNSIKREQIYRRIRDEF